jgi:sec-independent protein translocase protein TatA
MTQILPCSERKRTVIGDLFDSPWKILIVAVVLIVLFGSKKLPDAARSLGKSMRILKTEVSSLHEDEPAAATAPSQSAPASAPSQLTPAPAPMPAPAPAPVPVPVPVPAPVGQQQPR